MTRFLLKLGVVIFISVNLVLLSGCKGSSTSPGATVKKGVVLPSKVSVVKTK